MGMENNHMKDETSMQVVFRRQVSLLESVRQMMRIYLENHALAIAMEVAKLADTIEINRRKTSVGGPRTEAEKCPDPTVTTESSSHSPAMTVIQVITKRKSGKNADFGLNTLFYYGQGLANQGKASWSSRLSSGWQDCQMLPTPFKTNRPSGKEAEMESKCRKIDEKKLKADDKKEMSDDSMTQSKNTKKRKNKKIKWRKLDITEMEDGFRCAVEQELESCHLQSTNSDLKGRSGCRGGSNHISESISVDYKVADYDLHDQCMKFYAPSAGFFHEPDDLSKDVLEDQIKKQVEYYFSEENLTDDIFMRRNMSKDGYIPASLIASFNRMQQLTQNVKFIVDACKTSKELEVKNDIWVSDRSALISTHFSHVHKFI
nr:la-related protein 1B-like [Cherax quadricarinatus]